MGKEQFIYRELEPRDAKDAHQVLEVLTSLEKIELVKIARLGEALVNFTKTAESKEEQSLGALLARGQESGEWLFFHKDYGFEDHFRSLTYVGVLDKLIHLPFEPGTMEEVAKSLRTYGGQGARPSQLTEVLDQALKAEVTTDDVKELPEILRQNYAETAKKAVKRCQEKPFDVTPYEAERIRDLARLGGMKIEENVFKYIFNGHYEYVYTFCLKEARRFQEQPGVSFLYNIGEAIEAGEFVGKDLSEIGNLANIAVEVGVKELRKKLDSVALFLFIEEGVFRDIEFLLLNTQRCLKAVGRDENEIEDLTSEIEFLSKRIIPSQR